jgi:ATP-independent RNA helicase DbpA
LIQDYLGQIIIGEQLPPRSVLNQEPVQPAMATLQIDCGKKQKIRPGDILGALTGENGIAGAQVGKINVFDNCAYVAVNHQVVKPALKKLGEDKLKGKSVRARWIRG